MKDKLIELFGWYGTVAILGAYALLSFGVIEAESITYQILNLTGALGIVIVSTPHRHYQPIILNLVWAVIAVIAIIK